MSGGPAFFVSPRRLGEIVVKYRPFRYSTSLFRIRTDRLSLCDYGRGLDFVLKQGRRRHGVDEDPQLRGIDVERHRREGYLRDDLRGHLEEYVDIGLRLRLILQDERLCLFQRLTEAPDDILIGGDPLIAASNGDDRQAVGKGLYEIRTVRALLFCDDAFDKRLNGDSGIHGSLTQHIRHLRKRHLDKADGTRIDAVVG